MAGKPKHLGPDVVARIETLTRQGWPAERIAADPIVSAAGVSSRTIGRRMLAQRGPVQSPRSGAASMTRDPDKSLLSGQSTLPAAEVDVAGTKLPSSPDDIPEGASLSQLDGWIEQAENAIDKAELDGNLPLLGQMLRVAASLAETRRKATPPERPDPNDNPDMAKLGAEVAERLHKMIDLVAA